MKECHRQPFGRQRVSPWHAARQAHLHAPMTGLRTVLQHYAVKTIENVVSQGGEWAARFASEAVAADLFRWVLFNACASDNLRKFVTEFQLDRRARARVQSSWSFSFS